MNKEIIKLMKEAEKISRDDALYLIYHSDHSGEFIVFEIRVFDFEGKEDLIYRLKEFIESQSKAL